MRHTLTLVLALAATLAHAQPIGRELAQQRAEAFMATHRPDDVYRTTEATPSARRKTSAMRPGNATAATTPPYYVFNVGCEAGYVIVSGDDRAQPILGYADHGHFDAAQAPANMLAWLDYCATQIASLDSRATTPAARTAATQWAGGQPVMPLLATQWSQDAPFNLSCPTYTDGNPCVAGCVAVAMAQAMYHYRWPTAPLAHDIPGGYTTYSPFVAGQTVAAGTRFRWDDMLATYDPRQAHTDGSKQAVATLMAACGVAVETGYAPWGSGSSLNWVADAMTHYFDYSSTTTHVERSAYTSDAWHALIHNELACGRPVLYGGMSREQGHVFILDGYDGGGFFHINWGWGGLSDGYYALSALTPDYNTGIGSGTTGDGYNSEQHAVVGLWPNDPQRTYSDAAATIAPTASLLLEGYELPRGDAVTEREIELVCHVRNTASAPFVGQIYLVNGNNLIFATDYAPERGGMTIAPNSVGDVTFRFLPQSAGLQTFRLCCDVSRTDGRFAEISIDVAVNQSAPLSDVVFQRFVYKYDMGENHVHGTKIKGHFVVKNFNNILDYDGDVTMVWYAYVPDGQYFRAFETQEHHIHVPAGEECQFPFEVLNLQQNMYMPFLRVNGVNQTNGWDDICYLDGLPNDIRPAISQHSEQETVFDVSGRRVTTATARRRPSIYAAGHRKVMHIR